MKLVKINEDYYLVERKQLEEGNVTWDSLSNTVQTLIVKTTNQMEGWIVLASTKYISGVQFLDRNIIEKPIPTTFTSKDMMGYSNWVLEWCSANKYRKSSGGVLPFGNGEPMTDDQLFSRYLDSFKLKGNVWDNVQIFTDDNNMIKDILIN